MLPRPLHPVAFVASLVVALSSCASSSPSARRESDRRAREAVQAGRDAGDGESSRPRIGGTQAPSSPRASDPGRTVAPAAGPTTTRAGTYRYEQSGEVEAGTLEIGVPPEGSLVVEAARADGPALRQRQTREVSPAMRFDQELIFARESILLARADQSGMSCSFEPPLLVAPLPLDVGDSWTARGECEGARIVVRARVLDAPALTVGGEQVGTVQVRSVRTVSGDGFRMRTVATTWYAPSAALIVRETERTTGSYGESDFSQRLRSELVSLDPER